MPLPDPPPLDPNIQYALAYLLQALNTASHGFGYSMEVPEVAQNGAQAEEPSEVEAPAIPKRARKRRLPKTLSRDEVERLLGQPNLNAATGLRDRCMLELMYRAGMRVGEVCALEPRNVDTAVGTVEIVDAKGGDRTARFNQAIVSPLLEQWKRERRRLGFGRARHLFCTIQSSNTPKGGSVAPGGPVSRRQIGTMVKRRAAKAGVDPRRVTPHRLRHSFATHMLEDGLTVREVQELLGHRNLGTTEVYLSIVNTQLQAKMQTLDPLAKRHRNRAL